MAPELFAATILCGGALGWLIGGLLGFRAGHRCGIATGRYMEQADRWREKAKQCEP